MARTIAKDHDQKRQKILKSAARLFAEEGFDRASMTRLARACGISKANIYHYYDSKDALLFDLLQTYLSDLRDRICGLDLEDLPAEARLHRTILEILVAYQGMDHEHQVQISGLALLPNAQQEILRGYQRDLVEHVSKIVKAIAQPSLAGDRARLRATTMSVFGMLNWFYMWHPGADTGAREEYADLVHGLTMKGVGGL